MQAQPASILIPVLASLIGGVALAAPQAARQVVGQPVRAMNRDVESAREKFGSHYEWFEADVTNPASLERAMTGVDIVISVVATAMPIGGNRPEKVDYEGTMNLAKAAKAAGVQRFVIITSSVSGKRGGIMNFIGGDVLVWKGKAEDALVASGVPYVIVGPARIKDDAGGEKQINVMPRKQYQSGMMITRADLASVVIAVAGLPAATNRSFSVSNGEGGAGVVWQQKLALMPLK